MNEINAWLGTEESYYQLQELLGSEITPQMRGREIDEFPNPVEMDIVDGVGVLSVSGPLVTSSNWITRIFGVASYMDIQEAVADASGNAKVKEILIDYDTPGGYAKGCRACAQFIRETAENVKPIHSHTGSGAFSAGFWLYSAGLYHTMEEDSKLGSVGVILVHSDYSEMRKNAGIKDTIFRTGKYKALGHPFEKLSDDAKKEIEEEMNFLHNLFVTGISELSDIPKSTVANKIANGKTFRADASINLGMADEVLPLAEVISKLAANHSKPSKA